MNLHYRYPDGTVANCGRWSLDNIWPQRVAIHHLMSALIRDGFADKDGSLPGTFYLG